MTDCRLRTELCFARLWFMETDSSASFSRCVSVSQRIRPHCHVFGHIHEGYGQTTNGTTHFINASNCNLHYNPNKLNPPIVIDVPIPTGASDRAAAAVTG